MSLRSSIGIGIPSRGGLQNVPVGAYGDSITSGERSLTGGWRARMRTAGIQWVGPYTDSTGRKHGGLSGDTLNQINTRIAAQLAANPAKEVWILGGENDAIAGDTANQIETDLGTLSDTIATALPNALQRVWSLAPWDTGSSAVGDSANMQFARIIATKRAAGRRIYLHDAGDYLTTPPASADFDGVSVEHPLDGTYGLAGVGAGYGKMAAYMDRWFDTSLAVNPATLSPVCWYEADSVTLSGARATTIADQSGNGLHLVETAGSGAPWAATSTSFPGKACLTPNGTDDYYRLVFAAPTQPNTIFHLVGPTTSGAQDAMFDSADATAGQRQLLFSDASNIFIMFAGANASDGIIVYNNVPHLYAAEFNGASSKLMLDGNYRRNRSFSPGTGVLHGITLFASAAAVPVSFWGGEWFATIVFPGALTDAQQFGIAMYLRNKYGVWPLIGG